MKSGIYRLLNTKTGKFYIGSSNNLYRRYKQHCTSLKKNKSSCTILQRAYNKYGESAFSFEILATCPIEYLFKLEQWFVDTLKPEYNTCLKNVKVPIGVRKTKDGLKRIGEANKYKTNPRFGWPSRKILKLDNSQNIIQEYESLTQYALEHNCAIPTVCKAIKYGTKCKGFYVKYKP